MNDEYIVFKRKTFEKRVGWLDKHERFQARDVVVLTRGELAEKLDAAYDAGAEDARNAHRWATEHPYAVDTGVSWGGH